MSLFCIAFANITSFANLHSLPESEDYRLRLLAKISIFQVSFFSVKKKGYRLCVLVKIACFCDIAKPIAYFFTENSDT